MCTYQGGRRPCFAKFLSIMYTIPSVDPTTRDAGPGSSMTAGQASRHGVTLQRYRSLLTTADAVPACQMMTISRASWVFYSGNEA